MMNDVENLFMDLLAFPTSSSVKCVKIFCPFIYFCTVSVSHWDVREFSMYSECKSTVRYKYCKNFFQCVVCLFVLILYIELQELLLLFFLIKFDLSIFSSYDSCTFCVLSRQSLPTSESQIFFPVHPLRSFKILTSVCKSRSIFNYFFIWMG